MRSEEVKRWLPYIGVLFAAVLLVVFESDFLYTAQAQNLFLHTPLFFEQQMVKSGGLLTWAGCYLTQFFYYPVLGAGLLCLLWAFFVWQLKHAFRLNHTWPALVPVASLVLTVVTLGYWIYYQKLQGVLFDATVGAIAAVAMAWIYRILPAKYGLKSVFILVAACTGYPLFGFYGLWGVTLMALLAWRTKSSRWVLDSLLAVLSVIAVPLVCYHTLYHETNIVGIYWTALPVFATHGERFLTYYAPYVVLIASTVLLAVHPTMNIPQKRQRWISAAVLVVTTVWVAFSWYKDGNFHRELSMSRNMDEGRWGRMLETAKAVKGEPTRAICLMRNLALFRLGQTGDETVNYPNGSALPNAPFPVRMIHTIGKRLYLEYGIPNYCYRWCMEDGVEYGWTAERLRLMTLCSLANGEFVAAQHYISMLKKTDFHGSWARHYEQMLYRPQRIADDPTLKPIIPLLRTASFLTSDQSQLEHFLIEHLMSMPDVNSEQRELTRFTTRYYQRNRCKIIEP